MFTDNVKKYITRKRVATYTLCKNVAEHMEKTAKEVRPWKDRTAHARQSINNEVDVRSGSALFGNMDLGQDYIMIVSHGVKYGKYLEKGTLPHDIKRTSKKGKEYTIHHPGTDPYPAIAPAAEKGKELLKKYVDELWR